MLVDSHCHLDYLEADHDLGAVVGRAGDAGVGAMVTICTKISEAERVRRIAARFPNVYWSVEEYRCVDATAVEFVFAMTATEALTNLRYFDLGAPEGVLALPY